MGNALVVNLVEDMANTLDKIFENEKAEWLQTECLYIILLLKYLLKNIS